jgi:hypothetical protein
MTSALGGGAAAGAEPRIVFRKYAEAYVLAQVWPSSEGAGREVIQSRLGRNAASAAAEKGRKPEAVTVAARAR